MFIFSPSETSSSQSVVTSDDNQVLLMEFDRSCTFDSLIVEFVLITPQGEIFPYSFKLQFFNTNNMTEYESLFLGINVAQKKGINNLHAQGDVELVVFQVRNIYQTRNDWLKDYQNLVWDNIECFDAFNILVVSREFNSIANSLSHSATLLILYNDFFLKCLFY